VKLPGARRHKLAEEDRQQHQRFPGLRGRVTFGGQEFAIREVGIVEDFPPTPPQDAILIAVSRKGDFAITHDFSKLIPGDRALVIVPLAPFKAGKDTLAATMERFLHSG
jgi:hypothetical protein